MKRFIPPGYLSTEQAILLFSKAVAPDIWEKIPEEEESIWQQTVMSFNGAQLVPRILQYLREVMDRRPILPCQLRVIHFRDATLDLISRLASGKITAWCLDQDLRFGRPRKEGWKRPDNPLAWVGTAIEILETGRNTYKGGWRDIFLYEREVEATKAELANWARSVAEQTSSGRNKREAARILTSTHEVGTAWPSLEADRKLLKGVPECRNLSRDEIDALRKHLNPGLLPKRGRPKKKSRQIIPEKLNPEVCIY